MDFKTAFEQLTPSLLEALGLVVALALALLSFTLALTIGMLVALGRLSKVRSLHVVLIAFLEIVRGKFGENEILKGIDLRIRQGEKVAIIGPSGSGKSTFLRCINYLEQPTSGTVMIDSEKIIIQVSYRVGSSNGVQ